MKQRVLSSISLAAPLAIASCLSTQDFGGEKPSNASGGDGGGNEASIAAQSDGTWRWEWANPMPTGKALHAVAGTSADDLWVAGEGGVVAHFDGKRWDTVHFGAEKTRYFSIGVKSNDDVWIAGETDGKVFVTHYDGSEWTDSFPFAGGAFTGFSHGLGSRLFAVVDWSILELGDDGRWSDTDTRDNDVFGPPADIWTSSAGDAWAITTGTKLLHLPEGSTKWALQPPPPNTSNALGLAIAGSGSTLCAFYKIRSSGQGGFLSYSGSDWQAGPLSGDSFSLETSLHGVRAGCGKDGTGWFVDESGVYRASLTEAAFAVNMSDYEGEKMHGLLSFDGADLFAVGALGALQSHPANKSAGDPEWAERGGSVRKEVLDVDVGLDGTVMAVDRLQPTPDSEGEVLLWNEGFTKPSSKGFSAPSMPAGIAVLGRDDVWAIANDGSSPGINHWDGQGWGATRVLPGGSFAAAEVVAIFAAAKDDVWIAGRKRCPSLLPDDSCSVKLDGFLWHYDGKEWNPVDAPASYVSIHGTSAQDVWFAGDGAAHWDGKKLSTVTALTGRYVSVWSSTPERVWLAGAESVLYEPGARKSSPVKDALHASIEWTVAGIAESTNGDVFVLTKRADGTSLLWFDPSRTRLVEEVASDLELTKIRGRGDQLWAVGHGGAALRFAPPAVR